jgi:hypothetical protein
VQFVAETTKCPQDAPDDEQRSKYMEKVDIVTKLVVPLLDGLYPLIGDETAKRCLMDKIVEHCQASKGQQKLLENMVRVFFDAELIDEATALLWKSETEKKTPRSPALADLKKWFEWLKTAN